eukprot:446971_1
MDANIVEPNSNLEHVCGEKFSPDLASKDLDVSIDPNNKIIFEVYVNNNLNPESILIQIKSNHEIMDNEHLLPNDKILHSKSDEKQCEFKQQTSLPSNYVRISSNGSYSIPVRVDNKYQISFITVYVEDSITNKLSCICNNLQMNRQFIEINRDTNNQFIITSKSGVSNVDSLFASWSLPKHLANAMKNHGWNDSKLWNEISKQELIKMGFQSGHQMRFFNESNKMIENKHMNAIVKMLNSWNIPINLVSNMFENGWNNPEDWEDISDEQFKQMNFKDGHIVKFKKHIKLKSHTMFKF